MIGLSYQQLCATFDNSVKEMRQETDKNEEIFGIHKDESPIASEILEGMTKEFGKWNLSPDEICFASYLTILKVIQINNRAIEKQLKKAGFSL